MTHYETGWAEELRPKILDGWGMAPCDRGDTEASGTTMRDVEGHGVPVGSRNGVRLWRLQDRPIPSPYGSRLSATESSRNRAAGQKGSRRRGAKPQDDIRWDRRVTCGSQAATVLGHVGYTLFRITKSRSWW